jgi:hypothetical protein
MTARHRKCVRNASMGGPNGENEAQLHTGQKIRQECLDRRWIERLPDSLAGFKMYTATDLGRAMLAAPVAEKPSGSRISILKPMVPTFEPLKSPLGRRR